MSVAVGTIGSRPLPIGPVPISNRRGRLRKALHWVVRSPVRMLLLIALLVGVPVIVYGQILVAFCEDDPAVQKLKRCRHAAHGWLRAA